MSLYLIGDIQGCDEPLGRLLEKIDFSPSRDTLYVLGDLVNRGPASVAVLRRLRALGGAARCVLGNHDLSLLAMAAGWHQPRPGDTAQSVLQAEDGAQLLDWLRHQPLAIREHGLLMVHAGVLPAWTADDVCRLAREVEDVLQGPGSHAFLGGLFGDTPDRWSEDLRGPDRWRVVVNALTRLRFCTPQGTMRLEASGRPDQAPAGTVPWFDVPGRYTAGQPIACGHWSALGVLLRPDLLALDSGCVWGGCLSALRIEPASVESEVRHRLVQVDCERARAPGPSG